jgi:retinol dehydrogenase 12
MTTFLGFVGDQFTKLPYPSGDFSGKTIIVTGSNTGIGLEIVRHFVRLNASRVIMAVRSSARGEAGKVEVEKSTKKSGIVEVWPLDLSSWQSIEEFSNRASKELSRIDIVVENAGAAEGDFKLVEGHETTIMVSVLGNFYLALLLMPKLRDTSRKYNVQPTLAVVSSRSHVEAHFAEAKYDDVFEALANKQKSNMMDR